MNKLSAEQEQTFREFWLGFKLVAQVLHKTSGEAGILLVSMMWNAAGIPKDLHLRLEQAGFPMDLAEGERGFLKDVSPQGGVN